MIHPVFWSIHIDTKVSARIQVAVAKDFLVRPFNTDAEVSGHVGDRRWRLIHVFSLIYIEIRSEHNKGLVVVKGSSLFSWSIHNIAKMIAHKNDRRWGLIFDFLVNSQRNPFVSANRWPLSRTHPQFWLFYVSNVSARKKIWRLPMTSLIFG